MSRNDTATMNNGPMAAFFIGSLLGVTAGLLFAPRSGRESREMIKQTARDNYNKMQEKEKKGKEAATATVNQAVDKTKGAISRGQQSAEDMKVELDSVKPNRHSSM